MRIACLPSTLVRSGLAVLFGLAALPALAHPHVWVKSRAVVLYGPDGRVSAIRQGWSFDEAYSAYAVQGFPAGPDGKLAADKMAELAKINIESLAESGFFTQAKANGAKVAFGEPVNYATRFEGGILTLTYDLPVKPSSKPDRLFTLEVYDPSFFVDFAMADGDDAVKVEGAPAGCALKVTRPKPDPAPPAGGVSEAFFNALNASSNYGAQFSSRVLVACP
jgi:ABC-type uncharacterized transport system substrate-binding protein